MIVKHFRKASILPFHQLLGVRWAFFEYDLSHQRKIRINM